MRISVVCVGRFASRDMVGGEQSSGPVSGSRPTAISSRIVAQGVAVIRIRVAGGDQQGAEADHLGRTMPHPLGGSRIGDAASQPLGDLELALDLGQAHHAAIRGQPPAIAGKVNRLARNG